MVGRLPTTEDEEGRVVVISHWLWSDWFGRDPGAIGKSIEVSGEVLTIAGVMPPSFQFPRERIALWVHDLVTPPVQPGNFNLPRARVAPGTPPAAPSPAARLAPRAGSARSASCCA